MRSTAKHVVKSCITSLPEPIKRLIRFIAAMTVRRMSNARLRETVAEAANRNLGGGVVCTRLKVGHRMLVDLRTETEYRVYYTGEYDTHHMRTVLNIASSAWTVLDVGANVGFWTVPLGKATDKVYAFEPVAGNFRRLRDNICLNDLEHRITAFPFGLSDQNATVQIALDGKDFRAGASTGNAAIVPHGHAPNSARENVEIRSLDSLVFPLNRLDFIKLDIEGHEPQFLRGAARTITQFRPVLFSEINDPYYELRGLDPTEQFENWMSAAGYICAIEDGQIWRVAPLRERKKRTTDVFFLPAERATEWAERIQHAS